ERIRRVRLLVARGRGEDALEAWSGELPGAVLHREEPQMVLERVRDVDVPDRARRLGDACGDAGAAALARADRPVDRHARPDLRLPHRARAREEVGEVEGGARIVRAVDD